MRGTTLPSRPLPLLWSGISHLLPFAFLVTAVLWLIASALPLPAPSLPVDRLSRILAVSLTLNLVAVVVGVAWTSRQIILPLRHWNREIGLLRKKKDLGERLSVTGPEELASFAESVNELLGDLQKAMVDRESVNRVLRLVSDSLIFVSSEGRIDAVNPSACKILGYDAEELRGKKLAAILTCETEDREITPGEVAVGEIQLHGKVYRMSTGLVRSDGSEVPVQLSGTLLHDRDGTSRGMVIAALQPPGSTTSASSTGGVDLAGQVAA